MNLQIKTEYHDGEYYVSVVKQTCRGLDFFKGCARFKASNGLALCSKTYPDYYYSKDEFYVRGSNYDYDNDEVRVNKEVVDRLERAVDEYNASFNSEVNELRNLIKEINELLERLEGRK